MPSDPIQPQLFPGEPIANKETRPNKREQDIHPPEELLDPKSVEAKLLCQLASMIMQMSPWRFMSEADVFGFQDPVTSELGFISVMGQLGQHRAIAVYRGVEGLYGLRRFEDALEMDPKSDAAYDMFFEIPQIQLEFEPSAELEKRDRAIIKSAGFRFPKDKQPKFRSYRPGYLPWFITRDEATHLIYALTQTLDVASRFFSDPNVLPLSEDVEDREYLIRIPRMRESGPSWEDSIVTVDPPPTHLSPFSLDNSMVTELNQLPRCGPMEVDVFALPATVGGKNERPRLIYGLLSVDAESGFILGMELVEATEGVDLMFASLPEKLASQWLENAMVPQQMKVKSQRLADLLQQVAGQMGLSVSLVKKLPELNRAKKSLTAHFRK
jgi:hypothetical protein